MALYSYEAKNISGQDMRGEIEAANEAEARVKLRAQRLIPIRLNPQQSAVVAVAKVSSGTIKPKDLQIFTRQLATLLGSGIPILQSLEVLSRSSRAPALSTAINQIVSKVSRGRRLNEALAECPGIFDKFYVNMVRAGEETGKLDEILSRLAVYIEKSVKLKGKVKGALLYPSIIMLVAFAVIALILTFVIPKFQDLFRSAGQELPPLTQMVVKLSDFFTQYWWAMGAGIIGGIIFLIQYYRTDVGRATLDAIMIEVPLFGEVIQKASVARFSRTLSTLLSSGVGIMDAIEIAARVVGNYVVENTLLRARASISEGKTLALPLSKEKYIPPMVVQMISVGEQSGNLDTMLSKIADFYEDEVEVTVNALTSILEPLLMVVLGVIIAVLVLAMYLPIFNLAGAITGS